MKRIIVRGLNADLGIARAETAATEAEAARDAAVAIAGPVDGTVEALVKNTGGVGPLTSAALSNTFGRGVSVKEPRFGAVGNGVADDTAAIQAAFDSLATKYDSVYFPAGEYKVSAPITVANPCLIHGAGFASIIRTSSATANIFTISAEHVEIQEVRMTSSVTRTGGWFVDVLPTANRFRIEKFSMDGPHGGIRTAAVATSTIDHGMILNGTAGTGVGVRVDAGVDVTINDLLVDAPTQTFAGIYVTKTSDVIISNSQIIHAGDGLLVRPTVGDVVPSLWAQDTFFDNCTNGVVLDAAGGTILRSRFHGCWMSSSTSTGVKLITSAGGTIDGTDFLGCHVFLNIDGIGIGSASVINTRIADSSFCQNTGSAVSLAAGLTKFGIVGNRIGPGYGLAANAYGIFFNGGASNFQIADNDLTGNTVAAIANTPTSGANQIISDNLGTGSGVTGGVAVGTSPFTYTAGPTYETVCINGGTVGLVKVDGVGVFQQTNCTVRLAPGKSVEISYTAAPGVAVIKD